MVSVQCDICMMVQGDCSLCRVSVQCDICVML